jgi:hypothetical protein
MQIGPKRIGLFALQLCRRVTLIGFGVALYLCTCICTNSWLRHWSLATGWTTGVMFSSWAWLFLFVALPSNLAQTVTIFTYIRKAPCSNLSLDIDLYDWFFRGFSQSLQENSDTIPSTSFPIPFSMLSKIIWCYVVWVTNNIVKATVN